ncbi:MAG: 3-deoxy-7-phosphoheptulonate synthase [Deltaproteobacteria bacterium]|nr:MAG: 3-deoxy-7-phosphoheptulonate synthase [Deltaproteobacteria bacterium]
MKPIHQAFHLTSRAHQPDNTVFELGPVRIGTPDVAVIAGPCAVESEEQIRTLAHAVRSAGAHVLRGGLFKPRTSPYSFQGLGMEGLDMFVEAARENHLLTVTEVLDLDHIEVLSQRVDILQVGSRNMQNFPLLTRLGDLDKPILLKRGLSATIEELLSAAEYILLGGNTKVILCERGIRTFQNDLRFTPDISAIPVIHRLSHLPVLLDPSHSVGDREAVLPIARAAVAAGADGIMVEVHPHPDQALSDGEQSLNLDAFTRLMTDIGAVAGAVGRRLPP